jgi:hypothetical protein
MIPAELALIFLRVSAFCKISAKFSKALLLIIKDYIFLLDSFNSFKEVYSLSKTVNSGHYSVRLFVGLFE